jgi:hypothetical protein
MVTPNFRHRAERLDEIAERAELDDQDLTPGQRIDLTPRPQLRQGFEVDLPRQNLKGLKNRRVRGEVGCADAGEQGVDEATSGCNGKGPLASLDAGTGCAQAGCGNDNSLAKAPSNDRLAQQVGKADLGVSAEFSEEAVNVARNDVSAVPYKSRLVPCEKRVQRSLDRKGARVQARWQRGGQPSTHGDIICITIYTMARSRSFARNL